MLAFICIGKYLNAKLGELYCECSPHIPSTIPFPLYAKVVPLCSIPLLYMFIFHQKSDSFRYE